MAASRSTLLTPRSPLGVCLGTFRPSFPRILRLTRWGGILGTLLVAIALAFGEWSIAGEMALGIYGCLGFIGATYYILGVFSPLHVYELGIRARDKWNLSHDVAWADIQNVSFLSIGGLDYVIAETTLPGVVLWIPQFLPRREQLAEAVARAAGQDHLLARCLQRTSKD